MTRSPGVLAAAFTLLLALGGCQKILDFQDLEAAGPATGDAGAGNGGSSTDPGAGSGTATSGVACDDSSACAERLTCLYGFCRPACSDDTECAQDSVCLFHGDGGGCRLASETCEQGACENADLICGLDATCRIACGKDDSCDSSTQRCIAGTCVSTVGENAASWDCGGIDDGQITCSEGTLSVCNVTEPGLAAIQDCGSAALCEESLPADPTYDAAAPPSCAGGCAAAMPYCSGSKLLICKDDGSGPVGAGADCTTKELCAATAKAGENKCRAPVCDANEVHCTGGQTELSVERCSAGRDKLDTLDYCEKTTAQCNPAASACVALKVDATEVTVHDYKAWLSMNPAPDVTEQPAACTGNTSFAPDASCQLQSGASTCADCTQPVVCVDWCDAYAYCAARGQHLCGKIGGGMNPYDRYADAGSSEWMNGCSAAGQFAWTSGATLPSGVNECSYDGTQIGTSYPVGTHKNCKSQGPGYSGLFDMSGNVAEWEDSCQKAATSGSGADACRTRGGSWNTTRDETRCDAVPAIAAARLTHDPTLGFRCCG
jgi:sulfatase modifying factor 1